MTDADRNIYHNNVLNLAEGALQKRLQYLMERIEWIAQSAHPDNKPQCALIVDYLAEIVAVRTALEQAKAAKEGSGSHGTTLFPAEIIVGQEYRIPYPPARVGEGGKA